MKGDLDYTVVIATSERPAYLRETVKDLLSQSRPPREIIIVDCPGDDDTEAWVNQLSACNSITYRRSNLASAARQRNYGAAEVKTALVAFVDDDVELPSGLMAKLLQPFEETGGESVGGVAGRIIGLEHRRPSLFLRGVYALLAGYRDRDYGARLFGPALNTIPCYENPRDLVPSEWLNSTCVVYRNALFQQERFPEFDGYSYLEDVHLSARIGRTHRLLFHGGASYIHHAAGGAFKRDRAGLAAMAMHNRRIVAREVMGMGSFTLFWKQLIHRLLNTAVLLKSRTPGWKHELEGTWRF